MKNTLVGEGVTSDTVIELISHLRSFEKSANDLN